MKWQRDDCTLHMQQSVFATFRCISSLGLGYQEKAGQGFSASLCYLQQAYCSSCQLLTTPIPQRQAGRQCPKPQRKEISRMNKLCTQSKAIHQIKNNHFRLHVKKSAGRQWTTSKIAIYKPSSGSSTIFVQKYILGLNFLNLHYTKIIRSSSSTAWNWQI